MEYLYLDRESVKNGMPCVIDKSITQIKEYKKIYGEYCIEFYGNLPYYVGLDLETDTLREATLSELVERGDYILKQGEYIDNNEIIYIEKPFEFCKALWNGKEWIEIGTKEEIEEDIYWTEEKILEERKKSVLRKEANFTTEKTELEIIKLEKKLKYLRGLK